MSQGLLNRVKNWITGDPFEDEMYHLEDEFEYRSTQMEQPMEDLEQKRPKRSAKVVEHPSSAKSLVVVIEPRAFEESLEIIENLKAKKSVILNLHLLDMVQSQRIVDFLSGATHALEGHQQRIGDGVFLFTPSTVAIRSEMEKGVAVEEGFWKPSY